MPIQSCDPAAHGVTFFTVEYDVDAVVFVTIQWDWDGVSTYPDCDGPLRSARLRNDSDVTYYCNLPAKKKGLRNFEIPPHSDNTYTPQQLRQAGLDTYVDTQGITPHRVPLNLLGK